MSAVWISLYWIWTSLYEQKIVSYRVLHGSYWSQWKKSCWLLEQYSRAFCALKSYSPNLIIYIDCPLISMCLSCVLSYTLSYLALCLTVSYSYISLFRERSISPVINIDMSVQYLLKFRLRAFMAHDIQKRAWQRRPRLKCI